VCQVDTNQTGAKPQSRLSIIAVLVKVQINSFHV
jgi:hypothetical protein